MRVLFLNSEYLPLGGGAGRANQEIFHAFRNNTDVYFDCITSAIDDAYFKTRIQDNVMLHRVPIGDKEESLHHQTRKNLLLYLHRALYLSRTLMQKHTYDVIHAFFTVPAGYIACRVHGNVPYIVSLRGSDVPGYNQEYNMLYKTTKPVFKRIWRNAAAVVSNSAQLAELANNTEPNIDISIIPNGVDTSLFYPAKQEPPSEDGRIKILCVSRLTERKQINLLIQATADLREQYSNIKLCVAGDGYMKDELERLARSRGVQQNVSFLGYIDHSHLPEIYRSAHFFALPSQNEGMSNTILEAVASGLPIIATDTGDSKQMVQDNGFVIPVNDFSALKERMSELISNRELREQCREHSKRIIKNYTWEYTANQYLQVYSSLTT